jgi:hypothetical protein
LLKRERSAMEFSSSTVLDWVTDALWRLLILPRGAPSHAADLCGLVTAM